VETKKPDRLSELEKKIAFKKRKGTQLVWVTFNPGAEFDYDVSDASEDINWMIYEIKRLREENTHYSEFVNTYRKQMGKELGLQEDPEE